MFEPCLSLVYFIIICVVLNLTILLGTAFSSTVEGKNEEMSTSELSGGARIHYIFQSIFVKSLEVRIWLCMQELFLFYQILSSALHVGGSLFWFSSL